MSGAQPALWLVILGMGALTYGVRLAGFALTGARLPPALRRLLRDVPVAVFATLVATSLPGSSPRDTATRAALLALATLLLARGVRLAWVLLAGLGSYLVLRQLLPAA